ncbi:glycosyl hydrolase family 28-related protein [Thalassobaculum sp.]|uniref:glycosyl hydrolase family 28-related protein n=1 Tax=Thalassobaculum sp. TaxID=2022740 RepID=UPI0032ECDCA0
MTDLHRRGLLAGTVGAGFGLASAAAMAQSGSDHRRYLAGTTLDATDYGAVGDGKVDDTDALQRVLDDAVGRRNGGLIVIPPGRYRITRTLRVETPGKPKGNVTHGCIIRAYGARLVSAIDEPEPVLEFVSNSVVRFLTIEGLEIQGSGRDGHGLVFTCVARGRYIYNFCLRDVIVQRCGGDGCRMTGNIFEGQIFNSYFRDNRLNGATFSHGPENTVLSAVHVFGCVFGGNGVHGVEMIEGAEDIGFQGCYFLENGKFGLSASHGCTLLSHCGFENNHERAASFSEGDAGIYLMVKGTLVGCTAYSIRRQTHLIRSYVTQNLVMVGCTGSGDGKADGAGLARLSGGHGHAVLLGTQGTVRNEGGVTIADAGRAAAGRFPSNWDAPDLARLGSYRLWVDNDGSLRIKKGKPTSDRDGNPVGA